MRPRLHKILWNDWPSLFCALGCVMIWPIGWFFGGGAAWDFLSVAIPFSLGCAGFLVWRVLRIHRLFRRGRRTTATILGVQIVRDRGRLEFCFEANGKRVESWMPVHKSKAVLRLQIGEEVEIAYDPARPERAIVLALYG